MYVVGVSRGSPADQVGQRMHPLCAHDSHLLDALPWITSGTTQSTVAGTHQHTQEMPAPSGWHLLCTTLSVYVCFVFIFCAQSQAGVRQGDRVVEVDGASLVGHTPAQVRCANSLQGRRAWVWPSAPV